MASFFTRSTAKLGNLYVRIYRPKLGINWMINTEISVNVKEWTKAQSDAKYQMKYFRTDEGKKIQRLTATVDDVIKMFFDSLNPDNQNNKKSLLKSLLNEIHEVVRIDGRKAKEEVRKYVINQNREKEEEENKKLCKVLNYYDYFLSGMSDGMIRQKRGAKVYREGSISVWRSFGKFLKGYCPNDMTFDQINKRFADGFVVYLEKQGLMPKTINKQISCFRRLCNSAAIDERNKNLISVSVWGEREVKDKEKRAEIALNENEINALYDMQLDGVREQVRDVWMLGMFSCQRFSDYGCFTRDNFKVTPNGVNVIVLQQTKTGNDVVVPILDERVMEICKKYNYDFPKVETRTINRYVKEILGDLARDIPSLSELVRTHLSMAERQKETTFIDMQKRIDNGKKLHGDELKRYKEMKAYAIEHESGNLLWKRDFSGSIVKFKWELVGSHTSRRSAITNLYNSGLYDVRDLMSISGHQTMESFEGYIKRGSIEQAERIAEKARKAKEIKLRKDA